MTNYATADLADPDRAHETWGIVPRQRDPQHRITAEFLAAYIKEIAELECDHEDDDPLCSIMHPVVGPLDKPTDYLGRPLPEDPDDPYVVGVDVDRFAVMLADRINKELE